MTTFVYTGNNTLKQREAENVPLPELEDDDLEESETEEQIYTQENIDVCQFFISFLDFFRQSRARGNIWHLSCLVKIYFIFHSNKKISS
jgi:hypothetical protein